MFHLFSSDYFREKKLVKELLPKVSRTFALNIRVLNKNDYFVVATAYLICRYLDSIEDSIVLASRDKFFLFNEIEKIFKQKPSEKWVLFFKNLGNKKKITKISDQYYENLLWKKFHLIIQLFNSFDESYQSILLHSILKMTQGMKFFIAKYEKNKNKNIMNEEEMEKYCYYVAGTVGEMLTELFKLKIKSKFTREKLDKHKIDFGQGLQMINILKDFFSDKKRNWIYIPRKNIIQNGISVEEFFAFEFKNKVKILNVYRKLIEKANLKLENALDYTISIPRYLPKFRLFCLIPLMLAVKTSFLLKKQENFTNFKNKISKIDFFTIVLLAKIIVFNNSLIKKYFFFYR